MHCQCGMHIDPATHMIFTKHGKMLAACQRCTEWFLNHIDQVRRCSPIEDDASDRAA